MSLPGKLSIGFLQEDNPAKYFFRLRPILVKEDEGFQTLDNLNERYPQDGFIRIVPDKNEISHFKARMRALGRYCMLNLTRHPNENDKIRPNKNFAMVSTERNANIVYSDVVAKLPATMVAEVVAAPEGEILPQLPGTAFVVLSDEEKFYGPFLWEETGEGEGRARLIPAAQRFELTREAAQNRLFEVELEEDLKVRLMTGLDELGVLEPSEEITIKEEAHPVPAAGLEKGEVQMEAASEESLEAKPESPKSAPEEAQKRENVPAGPEKAASSEDKPWLQRVSPQVQRLMNTRSIYKDASLQAQSGLNPRRGRSLHDVVDEQWRQSRYDQLGHPVLADVMGKPVVGPIEKVNLAIQQAMELPEAQDALAELLLKQPVVADELEKRVQREMGCDQRAEMEQPLNELEAERLKLMGEIDELRLKHTDKRNELLDELRRNYQSEMGKLEGQNQALKARVDQLRAEAQDARRVADDAKVTLQRAVEKDFDQRMMDQLADRRAYGLMVALSRSADFAPVQPVSLREPSAGELVSELRVYFEQNGWALSNDEAVNILICLAHSPLTLVSGPAGSGKSRLIRLLAQAIGISRPENARFYELQAQCGWDSLKKVLFRELPDGMTIPDDPALKRMLDIQDQLTPTILMINDANVAPIERYAGELLGLCDKGAPRTLGAGSEKISFSPSLRVMMSVLDAPDAQPLSARVLDRAFMIRLNPVSLDAPWKPAGEQAVLPEGALSMAALKRIFTPTREVPGELEQRLKTLREKLARLGVLLNRRTLDDLWVYCATAVPMMQCSPMKVLDLALAQRALPTILASASMEALHELPDLLADMPACLELMAAPIAWPAL